MKSDKAKNLILIVEIIGFLLLILIVWLDELINLPGYLFGSKVHQIDLEEAVVETIVISTLGIIVIAITWYLINRVAQLEKFIPICAFCKKIRKPNSEPQKQESWQQMEHYINEHTGALFSHSVCPECEEKHYGNVLRKMEKAKNKTQPF